MRRKTRKASIKKKNRTSGSRRSSKDTLNIEVTEFSKIAEELYKYKQMVDSANHGCVIVDVKGDVLYVNDSFARIHGYSARWLLGRNLKIFHNAEQLKHVRFVNNRLIKTGKGLNNEEIWHKHRDGTVFPMLMSTWLMKDKIGRPVVECATAVDISELRKREAELSAGKSTLEGMLNASGEAVAMLDRNINIVELNERMANLLGKPREKLIGRCAWDCMLPKRAALRRPIAEKLLATGKLVTYLDEDYKGRFYNTTGYPLKAANGKVTGFVLFAKDITRQKKAEAEIEASKKTLESMLNATNDFVVMMDRNGTIIDGNQRMADRLGQSKEDLIGRYMWDFIPPKLAAARWKLIKHVIETGKAITFTDESKDGTIFSNSCYPQMGSGGKTTEVVVFAKDVTQEKKAEAEIEAGKKTLETMLNASGESIAMVDRNIKFIDLNKRMETAFGLPREKLIGRCALDFMPPKVAAARRPIAEKVIATGKPITVLNDDGKGGIYSSSYYPLKGPDGKVTGMVVFARDVTQQKKGEAEIEAGKKTLETMLNSTNDLVAMIDRQCNVVEVNKKMVEAFERTREELIGRNAWDFHTPEIAAQRRAKVERVMATGKAMTFVDSVGDGKTYSNSCYPLKGPDGKVTGMVVFAKDITQQKTAEAEINNYREELFKLRRSSYMDLFGAIMVHHFSQPLTIINMLVEEIVGELEGGSFEKAKIIESLKTCLRETNAAGETIKKMREHTGQWIKGRMGHFSPFEVINKVVSSLESKAMRAKIKIEVQVPESLPTIAGYRIAFEQIVLIITENAIEAADQKKWHRLVIRAKKTNGHIELVFSNDCYGIPKENLGKIFEPFYSTKTNRVGKGLGLGLPIVNRILTTMGGEIKVKSDAGKGTTFYITWPLS